MTRHQIRRSVKVECSECGNIVWTSSKVRPFVCGTCRRAEGKLSDSGCTSLTVLPAPDWSFGKCQCGCGRDNIKLNHGRCEDSYFYGIPEIDEELSERGRKSRGGQNDWVKEK